MRQFLYSTMVLVLMGFTTIKAQQIVVGGETKAQSEEQLKPVKKTIVKPTDLMNRSYCRRCGSENHMKWSFPLNKDQKLIPHCEFCGKKYWPKFKPSDFIERTYSSEAASGVNSGA